ncbi:MAG: UDP-2,3-diacylglucosamine diphosphatase LpxI [Pirellulales bacterium]
MSEILPLSPQADPIAPPNRVGLLAGWGRYPIVVAEALKRANCHVACLGIKDHADPSLAELCDEFKWLGLAKLGGAIRFMQTHNIRHATMAGKFHKMLIYQRLAWLKHLPDWTFLATFYPHFITGTKDRKDDTLLGAIVGAFAQEGIAFGPATDFAPELLVKQGTLVGRDPTTKQQRDIEFGWDVAKQLGALDVGQSVCVKDRAVLAVEAIEGTDACIRRAGEICPAGGFTVVKVAKPQQDMRFDVPTIGLWTLDTMIASGARMLAVEAGRTILLDEEEFVRKAIRHKITVVALQFGGALRAAA